MSNFVLWNHIIEEITILPTVRTFKLPRLIPTVFDFCYRWVYAVQKNWREFALLHFLQYKFFMFLEKRCTLYSPCSVNTNTYQIHPWNPFKYTLETYQLVVSLTSLIFFTLRNPLIILILLPYSVCFSVCSRVVFFVQLLNHLFHLLHI